MTSDSTHDFERKNLSLPPNEKTPVGWHWMRVWIGSVWNGHFPECQKLFSEAEICREMPEIPQKEQVLPSVRLQA